MMYNDEENLTGVAKFFNGVRQGIEAAESPFAKLAIFVLPVIAPMVPASMTGLHLYKLFLELFEFSNANIFSGILSVISALVLEILGYVGAISFTQSLFRWVKTGKDLYMLPTILNFLAYLFYILCMYFINVQLGSYFGVSEIINNIVAWLAFITIPTSLLAANYLSQKEVKEDDRELRREAQFYNLEKLKIKYNAQSQGSKIQAEKEQTKKEEKHLPTDWRTRRPHLTLQDVHQIANLKKDEVKEYADFAGVNEKTVQNWMKYSQLELLDKEVKETKTFPSHDVLEKTVLSPLDVAKYIVSNESYLIDNGILSVDIIEKAKKKLA